MRHLALPTLTPLIVVLLSGGLAHAQSKRLVDVTVTDPNGRFVTGLDQDSFEVIENGTRRPITEFSNVDSPIALAIVLDGTLPDLGPLSEEDRLVQTPSVSAAFRMLDGLKNMRKVVLNLGSDTPQTVPAGVRVIQTNRGELMKTIRELHNQYRIAFEPSSASAPFSVVLKQPASLPHLELSWR